MNMWHYVDEDVEEPIAMYTQAHVNYKFWKGYALGFMTAVLSFTAIGYFLA